MMVTNRGLDARTDQRVELGLKFIEGRMRVKLGITGREERKEAGDIGFIDPGVLQEAEDAVSVGDTAVAKGVDSPAR